MSKVDEIIDKIDVSQFDNHAILKINQQLFVKAFQELSELSLRIKENFIQLDFKDKESMPILNIPPNLGSELVFLFIALYSLAESDLKVLSRLAIKIVEDRRNETLQDKKKDLH